MGNALSNDVLTKLLILIRLRSSGCELFVFKMVAVIQESYDALKATLTPMKNIRLAYFPGENITNFCVAIFYDEEIFDSAGSLKT